MMKIFEKFYTRLGLNALVSQEYGKAERFFLKLRRLNRGAMGTHHNLGMVYLAMEDFDRAETCFLDEIENFGPNYSRAKVLGDLYYASRDREKSLKYYTLANGLSAGEPDYPLVKKRLHICNHEDCFRKAGISLDLYKKGVEAEGQRDFARAKDCYAKACQMDGTNVLALNNAGACSERRGDLLAAQKYFKQAHELSGLPVIGENLKKIEKAILR